MLDAKQIRAYLDRLEISAMPTPTKENLDALVYAHQTHIPFETIGVHRSKDAPNLSLNSLFNKIICEHKGGYCFELNKFFEALLVSLGYNARPALCRSVRGREVRMPINHRGIIVAFNDTSCFVDVGFGGPMPAESLPLTPDVEQNVRGEIFIVENDSNSWLKIDRITKAKADLHDDGTPARRQTELELCTAHVEDIDFNALNLMCSQSGTLFRDYEIVNLRTNNGYKGYRDGVLTIRENGNKTVLEISDTDKTDALHEHFGLVY
ncbi:arylamine N-acetyltransferase [Adlercreutzia sp. ZJ304]|uniref:arylamine N-acetyltransferase family protein n=1 Tax=Adlercreutzia sp. ZJ304 TaxID=2709791 RepID=UPI0013ED8FE4|nr:arylamine N-acetyltransferase [Adlercreutzia sp. ZJ304]